MPSKGHRGPSSIRLVVLLMRWHDNFYKTKPTRWTDECWIELFEMTDAFRLIAGARRACLVFATSTSQTTQSDQSKHTRSRDFNEAHTDVIKSNIVAAVDAHSDGIERATGDKTVESIGERGIQFDILVVDHIAILTC